MAFLEKLPAALRLKLAEAPFDILAEDIYRHYLRVSVRVGVLAAIEACCRAIDVTCADALIAERVESARG